MSFSILDDFAIDVQLQYFLYNYEKSKISSNWVLAKIVNESILEFNFEKYC